MSNILQPVSGVEAAANGLENAMFGVVAPLKPFKGRQLPLPGFEDAVGPKSWPARLKNLPVQTHHILTNKHSTKWTARFEEIVHPYGLDLRGKWNEVDIPHYPKGHPEAYHEWVYDQVRGIDEIAKGNRQKFLELYNERVKTNVEENPEMLFEDWWQ